MVESCSVESGLSSPNVIAELGEFYRLHSDPNVRVRPQIELQSALDTGRSLLVRDHGGTLVAASLEFSFVCGNKVWSEIGGVRVIKNGLGLFETLCALQVCMHFAENYFESNTEVFAVAKPQTASHYVLVNKLGFGVGTPPADLAEERKNRGAHFVTGKDFLHLPRAGRLQALRFLNECAEPDGFVLKRSKGILRLRLRGWCYKDMKLFIKKELENGAESNDETECRDS